MAGANYAFKAKNILHPAQKRLETELTESIYLLQLLIRDYCSVRRLLLARVSQLDVPYFSSSFLAQYMYECT